LSHEEILKDSWSLDQTVKRYHYLPINNKNLSINVLYEKRHTFLLYFIGLDGGWVMYYCISNAGKFLQILKIVNIYEQFFW